MERTLGIDMGTSSIGWAIVNRTDNEYELADKGVCIFQEGVARENGNEKPAVQKRTESRALRRHYFRRRLRKIELLKVLTAHEMCPPLSERQLNDWKAKKLYPLDEEFILWQRTDDNKDKNPYHDRYRALTEKLDLNTRQGRHTLGRALYHLGQKRGFLSNRKDNSKQDEDGKVKNSIKELTVDMAEAGCRYLGEYFYLLYGRKDKIRTRYTSRNEHYEAEFKAICEKQELSEDLSKALHRAIFFQRPLKSQKGLVGKCSFEKNKSRIPVSHPRFEEFRMLSFINNIRVTAPDSTSRPLSPQEVKAIRPLFMRKSKTHFDFSEIARKIAGKGRYACKGDNNEAPYRFNFSASATVSGCPVTAAIASVFGDDYLSEICSRYLLGESKNPEQILNDVWHALFSFTDDDRLRNWAQKNLQLTDEQAEKFTSITLPEGYASLSLNAINKILPYLRMGYRYDEAVFMANLKAVLPAEIYADEVRRRTVQTAIAAIIEDFGNNPLDRGTTKEQCVCDYLRDSYGIDNEHLDRLYHPSMIETYPDALPDDKGIMQLGSPRTSSVRNPMAMRALFRLRALVNRLLREGKIDRKTKINIEFSRNLNTANERRAIEQYQREREAENMKYADMIREQYIAATGKNIEPTETDILKYRLWKDQKHKCLYTGEEIGIADFIGASPLYDIEHTVPRSRGGDDSQRNKTLCQVRFNRDVKRDKLPSELAIHSDIMAHIESLDWLDRIEELKKQISAQTKKARNAATKEERDKASARRHYLRMKLNDLQGKYDRFTMTEIPDGFTNRQGVDIGIIGKYARLYLQSVFDRTYTVKGATTHDFRKAWGLQEEYTKKERANHIHHCIDAITIACIDGYTYKQWARYAAEKECHEFFDDPKPVFGKPWSTFTEDVKAMAEEVLVSHNTPDNMRKQTRKLLRKRGRVQRNGQNQEIYITGDTARGSLHKETFYGAIERDDQIKYVVRKSLGQLQQSDIDKIVDDAVRAKVQEAVKRLGLKDAMDTEHHTIWMNEEKRIPIRKVRIFAPSVTQPIDLKKQRDLSDKAYKQWYHVVNDGNYCMAIYEGTDTKGKTKRDFEIVSNIEAARHFKISANKTERTDLVPLSSEKNGYPLKWILKTGTMVLFYENSPEELYECSKQELVKRLYKVTSLEKDGRIQFLFHQEARKQEVLTSIYGKGDSSFNVISTSPKLRINISNLNIFVESYDFELTVTGEIKFKH